MQNSSEMRLQKPETKNKHVFLPDLCTQLYQLVERGWIWKKWLITISVLLTAIETTILLIANKKPSGKATMTEKYCTRPAQTLPFLKQKNWKLWWNAGLICVIYWWQGLLRWGLLFKPKNYTRNKRKLTRRHQRSETTKKRNGEIWSTVPYCSSRMVILGGNQIRPTMTNWRWHWLTILAILALSCPDASTMFPKTFWMVHKQHPHSGCPDHWF